MVRDAKGNVLGVGDYVSGQHPNAPMIVVHRIFELKENLTSITARGAFVGLSSKSRPKLYLAWLDLPNCTLVMKADGTVPEVSD